MPLRDLRDRVDYLTSTKMITSDKYGIWGWDAIGVAIGIILLLWGIGDFDFPILWRLTMIIVGALTLFGCSVRIERRYSRFKKELLEDIDKLQN